MRKRPGGRLAGGVLVALLALAGLGWWYRGELAGLLGLEEAPLEVSAEAAASAEVKIRRIQTEGDTVRLSPVELTSLLRFRAPASALQTLNEPEVAMSGDTLRLSGKLATDRLPSHPELDRVRLLLPDTARLVVTGGLRTYGHGGTALVIEGVEFAGIPIPRRYYPTVLQRVGRRAEAGLEENAVGVRLPPAVRSARVEDGFLVLTPAPR